MIFRLSQKLATKLKEGRLPEVPLDDNPCADWSAHLFTVARTQYIIVANTKSFYSVVFYGQGITDYGHFISRALSALGEFLEDDGQSFVYQRLIAPTAASVKFAKALDRSVTGSINELVKFATFWLAEDDIAPQGALAARGIGPEALEARPCSRPPGRSHAIESVAIGADPQIARDILGERRRRLGQRRLLRTRLPPTVGFRDPAHAFPVRKIDPSRMAMGFEQMLDIERSAIDFLQRPVGSQQADAAEPGVEQPHLLRRRGRARGSIAGDRPR